MRFPTSRFQPSINTKNKIFTGSEIAVGGSIIMHIDMVNIISMTRKESVRPINFD